MTALPLHWISRYIGREGVDCWGLLRLIYLDEFQIVLPEIPGVSLAPVHTIHTTLEQEAGRDWTEIAAPFDGCAVAMSQSKAFHHVGIYADADGGKVVHHWDSQKVIADTLRTLRLKGFRSIRFYRHHLWPT